MEQNDVSLSIEDRVINILKEEVAIDKDAITLESDLVYDLGLESFDTVTVLFALESEFDIDIPQVDIEGVRTVGDIVNYVKKKVEKP